MDEFYNNQIREYKSERIERELKEALDFLDREFSYGRFDSKQYDEQKEELTKRINGK